jgi:hypothetical protein
MAAAETDGRRVRDLLLDAQTTVAAAQISVRTVVQVGGGGRWFWWGAADGGSGGGRRTCEDAG